MPKAVFIAALALLFTFSSQSAFAQAPSPTAQALSSCITRSTTSEDHIVLVRWFFIAIARHPSLADLANIPDAQRVAANRAMGGVVNRLLLETCANETRAAFQADGAQALETPFRAFGESAVGSIMNNADVNAGVVEMASYIDQQRLAALAVGQNK